MDVACGAGEVKGRDNQAKGPFAQDVYSFKDDGFPTLIGGKCTNCGGYVFPFSEYCVFDGRKNEKLEIGDKGTLYSFTVIRVKAPFELPSPYAVGYVDLEENGVRVFMMLDPIFINRFVIGMNMRLVDGEFGVDLYGEPCRRPYFTPDEGEV